MCDIQGELKPGQAVMRVSPTLSFPKEHGKVKLAVMQMVSGSLAGLTDICLLYPLDVMKTRFQLQRPGTPNAYKSVRHCFSTIYRSEGFLSLYKGILPPIMVETPKRATKFFAFEQYKAIVSQWETLPQPCVFLLAGFLSGCTEAFVVNPFETVKVKLQSERMAFAAQKSAFATAREIIKKGGLGLKGINKALPTTICSYCVSNTLFFGTYNNLKTYLFDDWEKVSIPYRLLVGFTAGSVACVSNTPWDVTKSLIQGPQPTPGVVKYKSTIQTMKLVIKEEGFFSLYKGLLPKMMKVGPGGALMFLVFEHVYGYLQQIL